MSLQEAASSGSFNPRPAQPIDPQRQESPFNPPMVDDDTMHAEGQALPPYTNPYDFAVPTDDAMAAGGPEDMRAKRRRAWTVVSLAILIPAAVAAIVAWQLFGGDSAPAPTVTRVTTTPAAEAVETPVATSTPVAVSVTPSTPTGTSTAADTTTTVVAVTTSESTATETETTTTAATGTESAADLSSLDPAARLAAWTEIETIQVLPGETLWLIAQNYGTTISAIATLNNITDVETLSVGQELMIPVGFAEEVVETAPLATTQSEATTTDSGSTALTAAALDGSGLPADLVNWHTIVPVPIEPGDSLAAIADANNTSVQAIMALNGITDSNLIYVGEELLVPVGYQGEVPGIELNTQSVAVETPVQTETEAATPVGSTAETEQQTGASAGTGETAETEEYGSLAEDDEHDPNSLSE